MNKKRKADSSPNLSCESSMLLNVRVQAKENSGLAKVGFLLTQQNNRSVQKCEKAACPIVTAPKIMPETGKQMRSFNWETCHQVRD